MSKMKDEWARMNGLYDNFNLYEKATIKKKKKENKDGSKNEER